LLALQLGKPLLSYYPHRHTQWRKKERKREKVVVAEKRSSFEKKSFVVHHTSVGEGERGKFLKRMKRKKKGWQTYSKKTLGQGH
jgi:hypothetical protein